MLKTNVNPLLGLAIAGDVSQLGYRYPGYSQDNGGTARALPEVAVGLNNVRVEDLAFGRAGAEGRKPSSLNVWTEG